MMPPFIQPFRIGDTVQYMGKEFFWKQGKSPIVITGVTINDVNDYKYSTTVGAWIPHKDLRLASECDVDSIKYLLKVEQKENDSYFEDC